MAVQEAKAASQCHRKAGTFPLGRRRRGHRSAERRKRRHTKPNRNQRKAWFRLRLSHLGRAGRSRMKPGFSRARNRVEAWGQRGTRPRLSCRRFADGWGNGRWAARQRQSPACRRGGLALSSPAIRIEQHGRENMSSDRFCVSIADPSRFFREWCGKLKTREGFEPAPRGTEGVAASGPREFGGLGDQGRSLIHGGIVRCSFESVKEWPGSVCPG
jgi:hypothetical protein